MQYILGLLNGWNIWKSRKNDQFAEVKIVVQSPTVFRCKKETQFALHICGKEAHRN